jgi:hypothetical protein
MTWFLVEEVHPDASTGKRNRPSGPGPGRLRWRSWPRPPPGALHELAAWLDRLLGPEDQDGRRRSPRIRDLHELARQHYFHPRMGGRTSIKVVLPAAWEADAALRQHPWFAAYNKVDAAGRPLDPYRTLPALPFGGDEAGEDVVREGVGAVRAHQDLVFAHNPAPGAQAGRRQLLLQYCQLDTSAMVMIWRHWLGQDASPAARNGLYPLATTWLD